MMPLPHASRRILQVDLPIIPTIAQMVREHPGTISLGQGVVNYGPPAQALAAIGPMTADPVLQKYQAVSGLPALVSALRDKLARDNRIEPRGTELMVTAGSNMAFLNAVIAVADAGDEIVLPRPYYFNQEMAIRMVGCVPVFVDTTADFQLDVPALAAAIGPRTRAIVTVSPNNPTGAVYPEADLRAVNALCRERGLWHFSDEAYEWFTHDGATHFSPGSLPGACDHTLSFFSFSKTFGMASWRVGYVVYPESLSEAMNKVQDTNLICAPVVSQVVAAEAVRLGRESVRAHLEGLSDVRAQVHAALSELGGLVEFPRTRGAFYVLMKLPGVADALEFNRRMVREHRVATIPGFAFGLTDTRSANWQRLSYGALDAATVREGVSRFVGAVRAWYGHRG
jgi:aspartate/methionine/tyrosine aminotransferase